VKEFVCSDVLYTVNLLYPLSESNGNKSYSVERVAHNSLVVALNLTVPNQIDNESPAIEN